MTQIKLKIVVHPFYFTTDRLKVIYMLQWMHGRTMAWASSYLDQVNSSTPAPELDSWDRMLATATAAWGIHDREGRAEQKLLALTQASTKSGTVSEYRSEFQQVAQVTKWNDEALSRQFYNGLKRCSTGYAAVQGNQRSRHIPKHCGTIGSHIGSRQHLRSHTTKESQAQ